MFDQTTLCRFSNAGWAGAGRRFPGIAPSAAVIVEPRGAAMVELAEGDLLSLPAAGQGAALLALVFDDRGRPAPGRIGLAEAAAAPGALADVTGYTEPLRGWLAAHGGAADGPLPAAVRLPAGDEATVLAARGACTLWLFQPAAREPLVGAEGPGAVRVEIARAPRKAPPLPPPLGAVREEFTVPRGTARAYALRPGEVVQIIDVMGQQCSDFQATRRAALDAGAERFIDATATRSMVRRAYPGPGLFDKFFDAELRPLMRLVQDTCGRHDTFGLACTARGYAEAGFPGHVNCSDNISHALAPHGVAPRPAWPAVNFFWNTWIDATGALMTEESHSRPGDYVALRALDDLVCVSTACPDDIDPINGWNPTDVHVRIYRAEAPIRRAVAYREKEDAPMLVSQESPFHARTAPLTGQFAPARDLWMPVVFPGVGTLGEYRACREAVTVQDMSSLRKFDVVGPDAERLLQAALTRDVARLSQWRGTYALMCDERGELIDDGTLFRLGPQTFRWCCGSEESGRALTALAEERGLQVRVRDMRNALPNLAVQGPRSRELLGRVVFTQPHVPALEQLKWFGVTVARLGGREGPPFLLARTGYTGELGYEIFCAASDAVAIWDGLMAAGADLGVVPMGSAALEILRIEAGFAAAGAEFAPGVDAYEAGLGFAVDMRKTGFCGRAALERNAAAPRRVLRGLLLDCDDVPRHGAPVLCGERQVGVVTSATRSPALERAIAMVRLAVEQGEPGTALEVGMMDGRMKRLSARVCTVPFVDPTRSRARG